MPRMRFVTAARLAAGAHPGDVERATRQSWHVGENRRLVDAASTAARQLAAAVGQAHQFDHLDLLPEYERYLSAVVERATVTSAELLAALRATLGQSGDGS